MRPTGVMIASLLLAVSIACAQAPLVRNPGFEEGVGGAPDGWLLSGGVGGWEKGGRAGDRCVSVTGDGKDGSSNFWRSPDLAFVPGQTYRFSFWVKAAPGTSGGCVVSGPSFANRDYNASEQWEQREFVFSAPDDVQGAFLRLGQWMVTGQTFFDDARLVPVQPLHRTANGVELGAGESIAGGKYLARLDFGYEGSNYSRCLSSNRSAFNSNRWPMGNGSSIIYRHRVGATTQRAAAVKVTVGYYQGGRLTVEASRDAQTWTPLGELEAVGSLDKPLPAALFPADEIYVRLQAASKEGGGDAAAANLQVHGYEYSADLAGAPPDMKGSTTFLELTRPNDNLKVASLGDLLPGGNNVVELVAKGGALPKDATVRVTLSDEAGHVRTYDTKTSLPTTGQARLAAKYEVRDTGPQTIRIAVAPPGAAPLLEAEARLAIADPYKSDFGYLLSADNTSALWWAESPYKISRERPLPEAKKPAVELEAAKNEYEAVQLVLRPTRDLDQVQVKVSDLKGPANARIPADAIEVDLVEYVNVRIPTDEARSEGFWPDPLPPASQPFAAPAGKNRPLWITVHVPKDAAAGRYDGAVELTAPGWKQSAPLRLRVFDFALPDETHLQSGFGLSAGPLKDYHNLETNDEVRQVFDCYLRNFAAHRISPYDPMQLDPMQVQFTGLVWWGGTLVTDEKAGGRASLKIVDDSPTTSIDARTSDLIPIDPKAPYVVRWACKTEKPGQKYMVTLGSFDANRAWMSGHNIDLEATGTGEWLTEEQDLTGRFAPEVRYTNVTLRPVTWTEDGRFTGTAWFDNLELRAKAGGPNLIPDPDFEQPPGAGDVQIDFTAWDRAAKHAFEDLHMNSFALPIQGMGGGTFQARSYGRIGPYPQGTPEYEALMTKYLHRVEDHLAEKGWLDKQYIYWFDEPEPRDYPFVKEGMELLKRCGPRLRRMLTEEPEAPLFGAVDLWCPVVPNMDPVACAERQKAGNQVWWYVCTGPKAPYTTLFIDHNAIEMRTWVWMTWKWNIQGILIWATNYWTSDLVYAPPKLQNPWEDPMSYTSGYGLPVGTVSYWGNGDGRLLYPPNRRAGEDKTKHLEGPVNCIRWEMLRDGIEDYEYFYLLRSLVERAKGKPEAAEAAKLLAIPETIITDKTRFSRDPQLLLEHRRKVAEAIERM